jgi:NAD(P)-dependent dehydrogenase (short-subunit alcohol dehydrogenase family)
MDVTHCTGARVRELGLSLACHTQVALQKHLLCSTTQCGFISMRSKRDHRSSRPRQDASATRKVVDAFDRIYRETGRIDVLYNNVGLISPDDKSALAMSTDTLDRVFADNFRTTWLCCKHGIAHMLKAERVNGSVINSSSFLAIATPQLDAVFAKIGPDVRDRRFRHMPLGRFGTLDELAGTVDYLASDDAGFVTASLFPIDGGIQGAFTAPATSAPLIS